MLSLLVFVNYKLYIVLPRNCKPDVTYYYCELNAELDSLREVDNRTRIMKRISTFASALS